MLRVEARGGQEEEMRRTGRDLAVREQVGVFAEFVGLDRDRALEIIAYEVDFLDVTWSAFYSGD